MKNLSFAKRKECLQFIKSHHGAMTQIEMMKQLKVGKMTVTRLVKELGLQKRFYKRKPLLQSSGSRYFNVSLSMDWLVGKH